MVNIREQVLDEKLIGFYTMMSKIEWEGITSSMCREIHMSTQLTNINKIQSPILLQISKELKDGKYH